MYMCMYCVDLAGNVGMNVHEMFIDDPDECSWGFVGWERPASNTHGYLAEQEECSSGLADVQSPAPNK